MKMDMGHWHPGFAPQKNLCSNVDHFGYFFLFLVSRRANEARAMLTTLRPSRSLLVNHAWPVCVVVVDVASNFSVQMRRRLAKVRPGSLITHRVTPVRITECLTP